jgi:hypothetical protein
MAIAERRQMKVSLRTILTLGLLGVCCLQTSSSTQASIMGMNWGDHNDIVPRSQMSGSNKPNIATSAAQVVMDQYTEEIENYRGPTQVSPIVQDIWTNKEETDIVDDDDWLPIEFCKKPDYGRTRHVSQVLHFTTCSWPSGP